MIYTVLVKFKYGYITVESAGTAGNDKRKTFNLDLSAYEEYSSAVAAANAVLTSLGQTHESISVSVEPASSADWPGDGYSIGDAVRTYGIDGTLDTYKCVGINSVVDQNGYISHTPTFNNQAEEYLQRVTRWLAQISQGTLSGRLTAASPTSDTLTTVPTGALTAPTIPNFNYSGELAPGISAYWVCDDWIALTRIRATLTSPATAGQVYWRILVTRGGVTTSEWGGTMTAGVTKIEGTVFSIIEPGDIVYQALFDVGSGSADPERITDAENLNIQYTGAQLFLYGGPEQAP
jgi:hypothetical protein